MQVGAGGVEVRVVAGIERLHLVLAHRVVLVGHQVGHVDELHMPGPRNVSSPLAEMAGTAFHPAVLPDVAHGEREAHLVACFRGLEPAVGPEVANGEREHDGCGTLGLGVRDHLAHIPAERVDDLVFFREQIVDFLRLLADPRERAAGAGRVVDGTAIVMAELNQHDVATFDVGQQLVPQTLGDERAAAAAAARAIDDVDLHRVEVISKGHRPALLVFAGAAGGGGVARNENAGQRGMDGDSRRWRVGRQIRGQIGRRCRRSRFDRRVGLGGKSADKEHYQHCRDKNEPGEIGARQNLCTVCESSERDCVRSTSRSSLTGTRTLELPRVGQDLDMLRLVLRTQPRSVVVAVLSCCESVVHKFHDRVR